MKAFDVIVADPPWKTTDKNANGKRGAQLKYSCMPTADICQMQLPVISEDAWLFIWKIACMPVDAYQVAKAWGFIVKAEIVWQKLTKNGAPHFGLGHYTRGSHETCIIATRGKVKPSNRGVRSIFAAKMPVEPAITKKSKPATKYIHSAKPDEFYKLVEKLTGPGLARVEMFGRRQRRGWTVLGNEATKFQEAI